jgi:hypothetical protein
MLKFAYAAEHRLLVIGIGGGTLGESDYEMLITAFAVLDARAAEERLPAAVLAVVSTDLQSPTVQWRRRFAELRTTRNAPSTSFALVTDSAGVRGAITAINWIIPEPPHQKTRFFDTTEEAVAWLEIRQAERLPMVPELTRRVSPAAGA